MVRAVAAGPETPLAAKVLTCFSIIAWRLGLAAEWAPQKVWAPWVPASGALQKHPGSARSSARTRWATNSGVGSLPFLFLILRSSPKSFRNAAGVSKAGKRKCLITAAGVTLDMSSLITSTGSTPAKAPTPLPLATVALAEVPVAAPLATLPQSTVCKAELGVDACIGATRNLHDSRSQGAVVLTSCRRA